MAKGDTNRVQNQADYQYGRAQNQTGNLAGESSRLTNNTFLPNYSSSVGQNLNDYNSIMNSYSTFLGGNPNTGVTGGFGGSSSGGSSSSSGGGGGMPSGGGWGESWAQQDPEMQMMRDAYASGHRGQDAINYIKQKYGQDVGAFYGDSGIIGLKNAYITPTGDLVHRASSGGGGSQFQGDYGALGPAIEGYMNFANTGGFSPQDIQNLRARAVAPIRSIYSNAQDELARQKNLGGGYMPNYGAAASKLARESSQQIGDMNTNAEAQLAQMQQQGRLYGLAGLANAGLTGRTQALQGLSGAGSLYGTTPGLTNMFGQQVLGSQAQGIDIQQLLNQLASGRVNAQLGQAQVPGNYQQALGNIGSTLGLAGTIGGLFG